MTTNKRDFDNIKKLSVQQITWETPVLVELDIDLDSVENMPGAGGDSVGRADS